MHTDVYIYIDDVWPWYVIPVLEQPLTNLTAFVSSWSILPLDSTLSVQRSMSSWLGISTSNLTWFLLRDNTNFQRKDVENPWIRKTERGSVTTLVKLHWHYRRVDSLILAMRKPRANIKLPFLIGLPFRFFFIMHCALVDLLLTHRLNSQTELIASTISFR